MSGNLESIARRRPGNSAFAVGLLLLAGTTLQGCGDRDRPDPDAIVTAPAVLPRLAPAEDDQADRIPFTVPEGFVAERIAGPPLVTHPMFACFDDRGRLYVAGTPGEYHELDAEARLADPPDWIRCLEDTDGDGVFDRSTLFADKLTYPEGILWHDGAVYTASPPSLWRLEDTDGDGVADRRDELATGFPFTGIADDMHGPCLGPDGYLYCGVGRFEQAIRRPGGPVIRRGQTPLIVRCRTDGEDLEIFSFAMGNPVEVAFSAEGEAFACGTFLALESQGEGLRDALVHSVYGGLYSVRDRGLDAETHTGDLLPPLAQLGVAAGSGLMRARGGVFGDEGQTHLYSALFNLHEVWSHTLERDGATFRATNETIVASSLPDFHPTDVLEDADGSLVVVDTGGWFLSCPTSQIDKQDVQGAIYRIRREGSTPTADPRGLELAWDDVEPAEMARRLDDPRFAVRDRALQALARAGSPAVAALEEALRGPSALARRAAVWSLCRIDGDEARAADRLALADADSSVRLAAASAAGLHRDAGALPRLMEMVVSDEVPVRREAATALGRIDRGEAVPALLGALGAGTDRFLAHALIFALIEIADRETTLPALDDPNPEVRRGALIALDQMEDGGLTPELVTPCIDPEATELRNAAMHVVARHPEWAGRMVEPLRDWLDQHPLSERRRNNIRRVLLAFARDSGIQELSAQALRRTGTPVETRVLLLEMMSQAALVEPPLAWVEAVGEALVDPDEDVARPAIAAARSLGATALDQTLIGLARDGTRSEDLRLEAIGVVSPRVTSIEPALFRFLMDNLRVDRPPLARMAAARSLGQVHLKTDQLLTLTGEVAQAGALVLPRLLPAFERSSDRRVGEALVAALARSPGLRNLTPDALVRSVATYPPEVRHALEPLREKSDVDEVEKAALLAEMQPILVQGEPLRGHDLFFGTKATCSTCHSVHSEGGRVGPDLSKIGKVRTGRDLLEAILFPNRSFARGFEPFLIATDDGRIHSGLIVRETAEAITLLNADRIETRVPRSTIETIEPDRTSLMPRGLEAHLSRQELADLISFLQSNR